MAFRLTMYQRRAAAFLHDMIMTATALVLCFVVRFDSNTFVFWTDELYTLIALMLPFGAVVYWYFSLYRGIWRFASLPDLINIAKSVGVMTVALALIDFLTRELLVVPRGIVLIYPFVQVFFLSALRIAYRVYRTHRSGAVEARKSGSPALIVGTGAEAEIIVRSLQTFPSSTLRAKGLLSMRPGHVGQAIHGVPVLGVTGELERVFAEMRVAGDAPKQLIVTHEALERAENMEDMLATAERLGLLVSKLDQPLADMPRATDRVKLAPVEIEDLLGRAAHPIDYDVLADFIAGKRIVVTGGGGSIGQELCRQVTAMGAEALMIMELSEYNLYAILEALKDNPQGVPVTGRLCDVRDREQVFRQIDRFQPHMVLHAAALKHVPLMEEHLVEATRTNVLGTNNVAEAAKASGAEAMVLVSSDKAVRPANVIGFTKHFAEIICQSLNEGTGGPNATTRFFCVRFGNVLGSSGSVVPRFWEQIRTGGPVTVTHKDMERYFMTVREAVSLILRAAAFALTERPNLDGKPIRLFALDMGAPQKITELAERMIRFAGLTPGRDIEIAYTGVRPGEKLTEELYDDSQPLHETAVRGLLAAEEYALPRAEVADMLRRLEAACEARDEGAVQAILANPESAGEAPENASAPTTAKAV